MLPRGHPMPEQVESRPVSPWSLMLGTGPRFARDAFGPVLVFYLGWKLVDLRTGILAATALAVVAYVWERRRDRSGVTADRKSTRLNSSHVRSSYAVFCLK